MGGLEDVYLSSFDLGTLTDEQRKAFAQHAFTHFPTALFIALHFVTLGIFTTIYCGLKHSRLPVILHDDFKAGKAIGYLFIPFFNLYWIFKFWVRLVERVDFQFRLRSQAPPVSRGLSIVMVLLMIISGFASRASSEVGLVAFCIVLVIMLVVAVQIQNATNKLARESRFGEGSS